MSFLQNLFRKNTDEPEETESVSESIIKAIGLDCEIIPPTKDVDALFKKYLSAYKCGKEKGFVPVFIAADENVAEMLEDNPEDSGKSAEEYRQWLISADHDNGSDFLKETFDEQYKAITEEWTPEKLYGKFEGGEALNIFISWREYSFTKTHELIYAEIPVKNPWEIFAWIPVGGWNECPMPEDIMSVSKLWYEKYGAVPAFITGDTIEYYLPAPVSDRDEALKIAEQHYAFCPDSVDQGVGTIKCLANSISKSTVWYFWWD